MSKPRGYYTLFWAYSHCRNLLKMQIPNGSVHSFSLSFISRWLEFAFLCADFGWRIFYLRSYYEKEIYEWWSGRGNRQNCGENPWRYGLPVSLTRAEPDTVLGTKNGAYSVNLAYNTLVWLRSISLSVLLFCCLKLLRIWKDVFFSGFLVWLRADILNIFQARPRRKEQKRRFWDVLRFNSCQASRTKPNVDCGKRFGRCIADWWTKEIVFGFRRKEKRVFPYRQGNVRTEILEKKKRLTNFSLVFYTV